MPTILTKDNAVSTAFPNMCWFGVIVPPGVLMKFPIPLPSIAQVANAKASNAKVKIKNKPPIVQMDDISNSNGDEVSIPFGKGLISHKAMDKHQWPVGSVKVFMGGKGAVLKNAIVTANAMNAIANVNADTQTIVHASS
jgi:hypothetical protein